MMFLAVFAAVWIACGVVTYGSTFAYFQRRWPALAIADRDWDRGRALSLAVFGPIGLIVVAAMTGLFKHGFMWR